MSEVYGGVFDENIKSFSKLTQFTETSKCSSAWNMSEYSFDIINQRPGNSHKQKLVELFVFLS